MAQLAEDCFAFGGPLLAFDAALDELLKRAVTLAGTERVPLAEADGRILAAPLVASRSVPPHDNSAVDGYAVHFDDLAADAETVLAVGGRAAAGHPLGRPAQRGEAIRIFTGAPMPPGPDTILMQEDCREAEGRVTVPPGIRRGANRRKAGEDVVAGATVIPAGRRLRPQEVGLAASLGETSLLVHRRLRVALLSTGDEIREPGTPLPEGAVYDANRFALAALLRRLGCAVADLGIVPDDRARLRALLADAAARHDLILTSGGMSTGEEDHVKAAVEAEGKLHFWRLAIKPGRPVALGQVGRVPFLGLPGNPVAVMVTFLMLARPFILRLSGAAEVLPRSYEVACDFAWKKKEGRREFLRVRVEPTAGGLTARRFPRDGAGILTSMTESDGLLAMTEERTRLEPGDRAPFFPFAELA